MNWTLKKHVPEGSNGVHEYAEFSSIDQLLQVPFVNCWMREDMKLRLDGDRIDVVMRGGRFANVTMLLGTVEGEVEFLKPLFEAYDKEVEAEWLRSVEEFRRETLGNRTAKKVPSAEHEVMVKELLCEASLGVEDATMEDVGSKEFFEYVRSAIKNLEKILNVTSGWEVAKEIAK